MKNTHKSTGRNVGHPMAKNVANNIRMLMSEREIPESRRKVLSLLADNIDLVSAPGSSHVKSTLLSRNPECGELVQNLGLKKMHKLWEQGTASALSTMMHFLLTSKKFTAKKT